MSIRTGQDFDIFAGDDLEVIVPVRDQQGQLVDISDAQSIKWGVSQSNRSAVLLLKEYPGSGIILLDDSRFKFDVTSAQSSDLGAGRYYHEAEIVTSTGLVYTVLTGSINIRPSTVGVV